MSRSHLSLQRKWEVPRFMQSRGTRIMQRGESQGGRNGSVMLWLKLSVQVKRGGGEDFRERHRGKTWRVTGGWLHKKKRKKQTEWQRATKWKCQCSISVRKKHLKWRIVSGDARRQPGDWRREMGVGGSEADALWQSLRRISLPLNCGLKEETP